MEFTKKEAVDYAVEVVNYLNRVVMGLELNGVVCLPAYRKTAIRGCFLARAKDLIMGATTEQLRTAYDECDKADTIDGTIKAIFKVIGNKAPNPDNEEPIKTVWFGYV